jgi:hypothetical protein
MARVGHDGAGAFTKANALLKLGDSKGGSGMADATVRVPGCNVALISDSPEQDLTVVSFYWSEAKKAG